MKKLSSAHDKYFLRSLHQEIDLYDRKLAHLRNFEVFASQEEREQTENKLITKRATLEKKARELAAEGVEFSSGDLPRSFSQLEQAGAA